MEILYMDADVIVCIKPPRVLSTDEPGGLPDLLRQELGQPNGDFRTVHRLDRVVGGLMVLARNAASASELSRQVRENEFEKEYLAVVHHGPQADCDRLQDLLLRDKARKMTMVVQQAGKGVQPASLRYWVLGREQQMCLLRIRLHTGRTHQIRVQFASRGWPLVGERKYAQGEDSCEIALFSACVGFTHPKTGEKMMFSAEAPGDYPWSIFQKA